MEPTGQEKTAAPAAETSTAGEAQAGKESRAGRAMTRMLRRLLGLLIVFGLGAIAVLYSLYIPTRQVVYDQEVGLQQAQERITELEEQVASLSVLESENLELRKELDEANLHTLLLSALANVNAARVALAEDDIATARAYLAEANTIKDLAALVAPEQRDAVTDMVKRLELAVSEIDKDKFAALSDLDVLAANLTQLKNTFFRDP
ncbi:MAG: hypothetical protein PHS96_05065 [Anaerolineales bacterium]|nr:hypothetical protein [Anaerolineales bacterium]